MKNKVETTSTKVDRRLFFLSSNFSSPSICQSPVPIKRPQSTRIRRVSRSQPPWNLSGKLKRTLSATITPQQSYRLRTTFVIIGACFAGISTAHHLVQEFKGDLETAPSITIFEARAACSGATGRNGGHLRPDFYGHIPKYIERSGPRAGAEIAGFEIANLRARKRFIEEEDIDCDLTLARSIDVWCNEQAAENAKAIYDSMRAHRFDYMDDIIFYTENKAEGVSEILRAIYGFQELGISIVRF